MNKQNTSILALIKMTYSGKELEYQLKAWEKYPTLKTDCPVETRNKEGKRKAFVERLRSAEGIFNG